MLLVAHLDICKHAEFQQGGVGSWGGAGAFLPFGHVWFCVQETGDKVLIEILDVRTEFIKDLVFGNYYPGSSEQGGMIHARVLLVLLLALGYCNGKAADVVKPKTGASV